MLYIPEGSKGSQIYRKRLERNRERHKADGIGFCPDGAFTQTGTERVNFASSMHLVQRWECDLEHRNNYFDLSRSPHVTLVCATHAPRRLSPPTLVGSKSDAKAVLHIHEQGHMLSFRGSLFGPSKDVDVMLERSALFHVPQAYGKSRTKFQ